MIEGCERVRAKTGRHAKMYDPDNSFCSKKMSDKYKEAEEI
jgi:hypothetical protein